jgi:hypothetical protein
VRSAFLHVLGIGMSLVYYPLWVVRYEYRGRMYSTTSDGATGRLLFGRAPGNDVYRVMCLLAGAVGGNFILTSVWRGLWFDSDGPYLIVGLACAGFMYWSYRKFRYGAEVTIGGDQSFEATAKGFWSLVSRYGGQ